MQVHESCKYLCNQCDYKAGQKSSLKTHKISVHKGVRYLCNHCDYKAKWKSNLKTHERSVHESVKYPCNQCDYKATQKSSLKTHRMSLHESVKYPCNLCKYKTTIKSSLKIHEISVYFKKQQVFQLNILLSSTGSFISVGIHRLLMPQRYFKFDYNLHENWKLISNYYLLTKWLIWIYNNQLNCCRTDDTFLTFLGTSHWFYEIIFSPESGLYL